MRKISFLRLLVAAILTAAMLSSCALAEGTLYGYATADTPIYETADGQTETASHVPANTWVAMTAPGEAYCEISLEEGRNFFEIPRKPPLMSLVFELKSENSDPPIPPAIC